MNLKNKTFLLRLRDRQAAKRKNMYLIFAILMAGLAWSFAAIQIYK
jgi:hypothetical protein